MSESFVVPHGKAWPHQAVHQCFDCGLSHGHFISCAEALAYTTQREK